MTAARTRPPSARLPAGRLARSSPPASAAAPPAKAARRRAEAPSEVEHSRTWATVPDCWALSPTNHQRRKSPERLLSVQLCPAAPAPSRKKEVIIRAPPRWCSTQRHRPCRGRDRSAAKAGAPCLHPFGVLRRSSPRHRLPPRHHHRLPDRAYTPSAYMRRPHALPGDPSATDLPRAQRGLQAGRQAGRQQANAHCTRKTPGTGTGGASPMPSRERPAE